MYIAGRCGFSAGMIENRIERASVKKNETAEKSHMSLMFVNNLNQQVSDLTAHIDRDNWSQQYWEQGEFFAIEKFLPTGLIDELMQEVDAVRSKINRNFIPGHKKGGSVSFYVLQEFAPAILALYQHKDWIHVLSQITGASLLVCPDDDPHACALYFYTEPGDHIGYHYDTSYYNGARYTVLIGLRDQSQSRLVCRLHTKEKGKHVQQLSLATKPGTVIFFNGDKLHHAVTPSAEGEERIVLTMQYVTDPTMGLAHRWFSNMKDAVGYFGWPALFRRVTR